MTAVKRVLITGIGLVTPLGTNKSSSWSALLGGASGITRITSWDASGLAVQIAGSVNSDLLPPAPNLLQPTPRHARFALHAADEALRDAGLENLGQRCGVSIGVGMSGLEGALEAHSQIERGAARRVSPFMIPRVLVNTAASLVSLQHKLQGPCLAPSTACAAGLHAIIDAFHAVQRGDVDVMLAGGAEASTNAVAIAGFSRARALARSADAHKDPRSAARPFDATREGFVLAEGAGVLVLESEEHAEKRGVQTYAEIAGAAATADAFHVTAPCPEGSGAIRAMREAMVRGGVAPHSIGYVNAHATSTRVGDAVERRAIARLLSENRDALASSTKGATGHLLGAAGAVEAAFTALAVRTGDIPPTLNLKRLDDDEESERLGWGDLRRYVPEKAVRREVGAALCNSFGFGGTNACVALKNVG